MKYLFILTGVACLAFMLLPDCAPQAEKQAEPVAEEVPSTEADVAAIEAVFRDQTSKLNAGDSEGWFALHSEDIVWMPPNAKVEEGKDALRQWGQPLFDQFTITQTASFEEVKISGDWAFGRGPYKDEFVPKKEGDTIVDIGKFLYIFERQADKSWKITHVIWNSDSPPPEAPTTS